MRDYGFLSGWSYAGAATSGSKAADDFPPAHRNRQPPNWNALLASILLVAPFLRALWQAMQAADGTWLPANGDLLLFGAVIAAVLIGDSLRHGRPTRAFLLALAACLAAIGTGSAVFAIGLQFDARGRRASSAASPSPARSSPSPAPVARASA